VPVELTAQHVADFDIALNEATLVAFEFDCEKRWVVPAGGS
jgi:hypothetical protein